MASRQENEFADFFKEASDSWELERLYGDLADAKQRHATGERRRYKDLTPIEKVYLRGLLCGNNPDSIGQTIYRDPDGVRVALSKGVYGYVEILLGKRPKDWRDVSDFLEQAGYQITRSVVASINATPTESNPTATASSPCYDWGEAPDVPVFFGRTDELAMLEQWILHDRCRLVVILGMRGVGKTGLSLKLGMGGIGKTDLSLKLARGIQDEFDYVIWRSLLNAPKLIDLLADLIKFLSNQQEFDLPESVESRLSRLLHYLRSSRCLVILDNAETLLRDGDRAGYYRPGYEEYGQLFQKIGELDHRSCLLLTSREKPQEIALLEDEVGPVRLLNLSGLNALDGKGVFARISSFVGSDSDWEKLIKLYNGNPLALKLAAKHIKEVFSGNISNFLREGKPAFENLCDLLDWHFERLSTLEKEILYWLAINREPVSYLELKEDIVILQAKEKVQDTLQSLQRRLPLERTSTGFTLQPVLIEYMIKRLIDHVCDEIRTGKIELFNSHALLKALARDHVRESQARLILKPIKEILSSILGSSNSLQARLNQILLTLQQKSPQSSGYSAGNILNLLCQLNADLSGYDLSHLTIWQAYLQEKVLHRVNLACSDLARSVFTQAFGSILSIAFSPDGNLLAAGDANGEICLWHVINGQQLLICRGHTDWVRSLAFSPDGQTLASGSEDQTIRLWDVCTGRCRNVLQGHTNWIWSIAFRSDGQTLASGSEDQTVKIWDIGTGKCIHTQEHNHRVWSVAFAPDGKTLASSGDTQTVSVWEATTGNCLHTLQGHTDRVWSVAFDVSGQILATGSDDQTIRLWNTQTGQCIGTLHGHRGRVWSVAFNSKKSVLVSGSEDQTVRLWDVATKQCLNTLQGHGNRIWSVAFSSDGQILASGSEDQTVKLWESHTGQCLSTFQGHTNRVWSVALASNGKTLASGHEDKSVRLWDACRGQYLNSLREHTNWVRSVAFSPDGQLLASGSEDQTIKLWDITRGCCLRTLYGHSNWVMAVVFSPDGKLLASGSEDQTIRLWGVPTGQFLSTLCGHTSRVWSVSFSPDSTLIASSSEDRTIKIWDIHTKQCLNTLEDHDKWVYGVAFSPDSTLIASSSEDQTIKLWNTYTGECISTLYGDTNWVRSVVFCPAGETIACGGEDRAIGIWDIRTSQCLKTFREHTNRVRSLAFSSDGSLLISGGEDEMIIFWEIKTGKCLRKLRAPRPYEEMNILGVTGLTDAQKDTLKALGAVEVSQVTSPLPLRPRRGSRKNVQSINRDQIS